jgi:hypothetical protein
MISYFFKVVEEDYRSKTYNCLLFLVCVCIYIYIRVCVYIKNNIILPTKVLKIIKNLFMMKYVFPSFPCKTSIHFM